MVRLFILMFMMGYFCSAQAQNLTGKWVGYFTTNSGMSYTYEVNIEDDGNANLLATTFTKFSSNNYAKASAKGVFTKASKLASILETKFEQLTIAPNTQACLMNNYLTYYNVNGREILQGTYISNNLSGKNNCGTGTVVLTKEIVLLNAKKINKPSKKVIKKDTTQLVVTPLQKNIDTAKPIAIKAIDTELIQANDMNANNIASKVVIEKTNKKKKFINIPWVLISRDNKLVKSMITNNSRVSIDLYDNGSFESDSISVYDNNVLLFDRIKLSYKEFHFDLSFDDQIQQHDIVLVAHKSGTVTNNNSILIYKDNTFKEEFIISTNSKTNAKIIVKRNSENK